MDGEGIEAMWHCVSAWHGMPQHGCGLGSKESTGVGTGLCLPSSEAGEGGVTPEFILGSRSDWNWTGSGVQQVRSSGGPILVLPGNMGTLMDPGAQGTQGHQGALRA